MQDYRFDLELQIIRFHEINSNSNTCHCTAQFTPSMLGNLHVWVLQSWGELVRWLCVLAERGYTTWPPVHYFAFFSKFQVSDFRANEVQFTTSLYNPLLQSGSPEFAVDWKELHNRAENEPSLSLKFHNHFAFNQEKVLVSVGLLRDCETFNFAKVRFQLYNTAWRWGWPPLCLVPDQNQDVPTMTGVACRLATAHWHTRHALTTTLTLVCGNKTANWSIAIQSGIISDCPGPGCPHSALPCHTTIVMSTNLHKHVASS